MSEKKRYTEREAHRKFAADLFNHTWTLLEKKDRTPEQDEEMIHAAHGSRFHWGIVGQPVNFGRGDWQISRVYAVLGRAAAALHYAKLCLDRCEKDGVGDWDLAFAHEAVARAYAVAGNEAERDASLARAKECGDAIKDKDDRELLFSDLATVPGYRA